jgi:hypothetical protein
MKALLAPLYGVLAKRVAYRILGLRRIPGELDSGTPLLTMIRN